MKEIPDEWVMLADEWPNEKRREFVIKDNVGFGEWGWGQIASDWPEVEEWGLDVPDFGQEIDEAGDIVELDKITTTYNINIKCDTPELMEEMKFKLGITSTSQTFLIFP